MILLAKLCNGCGLVKVTTDFYKNKHSPLGITSRCKVCIYQYQSSNRAITRKATKRYESTARGKEVTRARRRQYPREKSRAHDKVKYAKQTGRLAAQPCEKCGEGRTHAHHDDYSKPLEVTWLCSVCHAEVHRKNTQTIPGRSY